MNLKRILERITGKEIDITFTDNRVNIISFKKTRKRVQLRIQRIFRDAPLDVVHEIGELIKNPRMRTPLINEFFRRNQWRVRKRTRMQGRIAPEGRFYNLREIFDKLNREYFSGKVDAIVTWGRMSPRRSVRKRTLGSYNAETRTIRINPILDSPKVPRYFIEYVLYHEMLHADIGIKRDRNGRLAAHTREFRKREREFRYYNEAQQWEKRFH